MTQTQTFDIEALPVRVDYVAEVPSPWDESKKNKCDEWRISIETKAGYWSTGYWTGLGLRKKSRAKNEWMKISMIGAITSGIRQIQLAH
jgi:hypothetical protein